MITAVIPRRSIVGAKTDTSASARQIAVTGITVRLQMFSVTVRKIIIALLFTTAAETLPPIA